MTLSIQLGDRVFTGADQNAFAELSGDCNPMHVDEIAARRTIFGERVVHGVHLMLWALDCWLARRGAAGPEAARCGLGQVAAEFKKGVLVGEPLQCVLVQEAPPVLRILRGGEMVTQVRFEPAPWWTPEAPLPGAAPRVECRDIGFAEAAAAQGAQPLGYNQALAAQLLPAAAQALPPGELAVLLASTRIVGMISPGLHSLYVALKLTLQSAPGAEPVLRYRVERANPRVGMLPLVVEGMGAAGTLQAFLRPAPCAQPSYESLRQMVEPGEFVGQTALVIGGSRGLGEVTAKLLAAGGARVMVSYQRGRQDAEAVAAEIGAVAVGFDIQRPEQASLPERPTHVYYFATPRITLDKTFSEERFQLFTQFYVSGFIHSLLQLGEGPLAVFYPSTIFLDEPEPNTLEYTAAKAAGEEACRQLMRRYPQWRIAAPRLPRVMTDQNAGVLPSQVQSPAAVMLPYLRQLATA